MNGIMRNSESYGIFKCSILCFIRPSANSFLNFHNPKGIELLTNFVSTLCSRKHSYQDSLNPLVYLRSISSNLLFYTDFVLTHNLLFGNSSFDTITNTWVLYATIEFYLSTKKLKEPFF